MSHLGDGDQRRADYFHRSQVAKLLRWTKLSWIDFLRVGIVSEAVRYGSEAGNR